MISYKNFCDQDKGRLGNQIFQYSLCKILSHINNYSFHLNPNNCFLTMFDHKNLTYSPLSEDLHLEEYVEKEAFDFDTHLFFVDNVNISGFFQNMNYYDSFINLIRQELVPNNKLLNNTKEYIKVKTGSINNIKDIACLHLRRCDYTKVDLYRHLTIDNYYKTVLEKIDSKYIFVISDDINSAKKEFKKIHIDKKIIFAEELDMFHDFYIMYLSPIAIIANSTFSLWSSLLSDKDQVFSPRCWFNTQNQMINNALRTKQTNWCFIDNTEWQSLF